jgi:predicted molibdopterin-dependent oxidoreductase YjgC
MALSLEVNGRQVQVADGASVLDAVLASGEYVPHLCQDPDQERLGACRTCLVVVEGLRGMPASCSVPAVDGMIVSTSGPELDRVRNGVLQLTLDRLNEHDPARLGELGEAMRRFGIKPGKFHRSSRLPTNQPVDISNPIWLLDRGRCILCQRCVQACHDVQHIDAISMLERSHESDVGFFAHGVIDESNCTSCGQCWATCPTTAIRLREPVALAAGE